MFQWQDLVPEVCRDTFRIRSEAHMRANLLIRTHNLKAIIDKNSICFLLSLCLDSYIQGQWWSTSFGDEQFPPPLHHMFSIPNPVYGPFLLLHWPHAWWLSCPLGLFMGAVRSFLSCLRGLTALLSSEGLPHILLLICFFLKWPSSQSYFFHVFSMTVWPTQYLLFVISLKRQAYGNFVFWPRELHSHVGI